MYHRVKDWFRMIFLRLCSDAYLAKLAEVSYEGKEHAVEQCNNPLVKRGGYVWRTYYNEGWKFNNDFRMIKKEMNRRSTKRKNA